MNQFCTTRPTRDPFAEMDQIFRSLTGANLGRPAARQRIGGPFMNVFSTESAFVVEVETPGVKAEDVSVEFLDGELTIRGERSPRELNDGENLLRHERGHGRFERTLTFGESIDADNIDASLSDGVLTVTVPKTGVQSRRIEVRTGSTAKALPNDADASTPDA